MKDLYNNLLGHNHRTLIEVTTNTTVGLRFFDRDVAIHFEPSPTYNSSFWFENNEWSCEDIN